VVAAMVVMKVCSFTRARVCVGVCVCVRCPEPVPEVQNQQERRCQELGEIECVGHQPDNEQGVALWCCGWWGIRSEHTPWQQETPHAKRRS